MADLNSRLDFADHGSVGLPSEDDGPCEELSINHVALKPIKLGIFTLHDLLLNWDGSEKYCWTTLWLLVLDQPNMVECFFSFVFSKYRFSGIKWRFAETSGFTVFDGEREEFVCFNTPSSDPAETVWQNLCV